MFIGEHSHTVDDKGRMSVPAKFRRQLVEGVVVTRGLDGCLWLYQRAAWNELAERISGLPITSKQSRAFARLMLAGAWDVELDSQGRVMIPDYLRSYANITKHVAVAGLYNRVEIWNEDTWHDYRAKNEAESDVLAENLAELGI